ncbi:MAG: hypothetical protein JO075_03715 [Acidimicrobiia bacterium]|nr:hypothetical protein [Acidimicrobiia bacterium]
MADVDTTQSSTAARSSTPARTVDTTRTNARDDWAVQTANTIERLVETVRSNTSDRLVSVARLVVFGLLAAILGLIAFVLFCIFLVRILDNYIPGGVWVVYLLLGGLFTLAGLLLWQQAWKRPARER